MARQRMKRQHWFVIALVVFAAVFMRASYIPIDPEAAVTTSEQRYSYEIGNPGPFFSAWSLGDGQAYVLIALAPSGEKLDEEIVETAYRFSRAGFGWATWAVSAGQQVAIPYAMAAIGALAIGGLVWLVLHLEPRLGRRAWLVLANPAIYIGFAGDTPEPIAILLLVTALGVNSRLAVLLLGVTRPTFLAALWGRWKLLLAGCASAGLLLLYSFLAFGSEAMVPSGGRLAFPFVSYFERPSIAGWVLASFAIVTMARGAKDRDWSWIVAAAFVMCFGDDVLRDPVNAWRAAGFLPVLWAFGPGYRLPVSNRTDEEASVVG